MIWGLVAPGSQDLEAHDQGSLPKDSQPCKAPTLTILPTYLVGPRRVLTSRKTSIQVVCLAGDQSMHHFLAGLHRPLCPHVSFGARNSGRFTIGDHLYVPDLADAYLPHQDSSPWFHTYKVVVLGARDRVTFEKLRRLISNHSTCGAAIHHKVEREKIQYLRMTMCRRGERSSSDLEMP